MPLHPQAEAMLAGNRESGAKPMAEMTVDEARDVMEFVGGLVGAGPEVAHVEDLTVPGPDRDIPIRVYRPTEQPAGVIVYFHGGGGVIGSVNAFDALHRVLAVESGLEVVAVDYALAPEAPYPAAVEEGWAVVQAVAARAGDAKLIVMGDSSGGGLAAVMARRARDAGGPEIALQVLVYPLLDTDATTASYAAHSADTHLNSPADMAWFLGHYAPDPATHADADLAPLRVDDLAGLAPAVILTAEYDLLLDEDRAYAARLADAGVPVETIHVDDQFHAFLNLVNLFESADRFAAELAQRAAAAAAR